jgi:putative toxin-antitoxin system antitoxin component (TIGR02293 family)
MTGPKKYSNKTSSNNLLEEPALAYYTNKTTSPLENFIARSITLLGMGSLSTFSKVSTTTDFISVIRNGVPKKALDNLLDNTGITIPEISRIIRTSDRTLRRYTATQKLNPEQSERVIELAKLYSRGEEVFNNMEAFKDWMNSTVMALGSKKPKEFLDTSIGIDLLMNELGKIEHGIFA